MEQNFDLFRWLSGNLRHVFLPQKFFCQYDPECDRGIDKTLDSISAVSPSVGFHFPEQRLTIEPNKTWRPQKPAKQVSVPWADCHFSVSLCTHYHPRSSQKKPLLRFFLRGGGSVHRLFNVCALGRLSFQCQSVYKLPPSPSPQKELLLRFFLRGRGVCTQAIQCLCLGQIVILVLAYVDTTLPPSSQKGPLL